MSKEIKKKTKHPIELLYSYNLSDEERFKKYNAFLDIKIKDYQDTFKATQIAIVGLISKYREHAENNPEMKQEMKNKIEILKAFTADYFIGSSLNYLQPKECSFRFDRLSKTIRKSFEKTCKQELKQVKNCNKATKQNENQKIKSLKTYLPSENLLNSKTNQQNTTQCRGINL